MYDTIAIIPAHNEEETIKEVITRCKEVNVFPIVIDDGSVDATFNIANGLTKVLRASENKGKGEALKLGFKYVKILYPFPHDFKYIVIIDADLQYNPLEIPKLIEVLKKNEADYIIGKRNWKEVPFRHHIGNLIWVAVFNFLFETSLKDTNCGFVAMKREVMLRLKVSSGYIVDNDMLIQVLEMGYRVKNVPVTVKYYNKRGLSGLRMGIGVLIFIIMRRFS